MAADEAPREETEEERRERQGERIRAFLTEKWGPERPCPYCGNLHFGIDLTPVAIPRYGRAASIPAFFITCQNCGMGGPVPAEHFGLAGDFGLRGRDEE